MRRGGISPESVTRAIDNEVLGSFPEGAHLLREALELKYSYLEVLAAIGGMVYLDTIGLGDPVRDDPVRLADVCSGYFVDLIDGLYMSYLHTGEEPPVGPIEYLRFLGRHVVDKLQSKRFIKQAVMLGDGIEREEGYILTSKGNQFMEAYRARDLETGGKLIEDWHKP